MFYLWLVWLLLLNCKTFFRRFFVHSQGLNLRIIAVCRGHCIDCFYVCPSLICVSVLPTAPGVVVHTAQSTTSNTEVNITWDSPAKPNGVIIGYVVIYSVYQNSTFFYSDMLMDSETNYTIKALGKYNII